MALLKILHTHVDFFPWGPLIEFGARSHHHPTASRWRPRSIDPSAPRIGRHDLGTAAMAESGCHTSRSSSNVATTEGSWGCRPGIRAPPSKETSRAATALRLEIPRRERPCHLRPGRRRLAIRRPSGSAFPPASSGGGKKL
jgi:hypothetical protein